MRVKIVAGNWKMNKTEDEAHQLVDTICQAEIPKGVEVIISPPFPYLTQSLRISSTHWDIQIAAQNCHHEDFGAYTGEVSAAMLKSLRVPYVILGHSERRKYFGETDPLILSKIDKVLEHEMRPIYCCGEPQEIREAGSQNAFVLKQLEESIFQLPSESIGKLIIAYEPVWAIGTGLTATPEQAEEMHAFIRSEITGRYGEDISEDISILYGGSCKPSNADQIFSQPNVDGGLIGGASLNSSDFLELISIRSRY